MKKTIEIYTDGSSIPVRKSNPHPKAGHGGWAFVVLKTDTAGIKHTEYGHSTDTTNNRMELTAVINSIHHCTANYRFGKLLIYTDSKYVSNAIHFDWPTDWKKNGWTSFMGEQTSNSDLWEEFLKVKASLKRRGVELEVRWIRGHNGNQYNEICDKLAKQGRESLEVNTVYE